jgi:hypothetical protein
MDYQNDQWRFFSITERDNQMPTGYTSKIYDGKSVSGKEFLLICARAFGACIEMKEDSLNKEIPEEFKVSAYNEEELKKSLDKLNIYENMNIEEANILSEKDFAEAEKYRLSTLKKNSELQSEYQKILMEVENWNPPTEDHIGLKKFAIEQLTESMEHDCAISYYSVPTQKLTGKEWLDEKIENCNWEIEYHKKGQKEENERVAGRNKWIKQLRESLTT